MRYSGIILIGLCLSVLCRAQVIFDWTPTEGCDSFYVDFDVISTESWVDTIHWDFGNGQSTVTINPDFEPDPVFYADPGFYDVILYYNNDFANPDTFDNIIRVYKTVDAQFGIREDDNNVYYFSQIELDYGPGPGYLFEWEIYDEASRIVYSTDTNLYFTADIGDYMVYHTVREISFGCESIDSISLMVLEEVDIPNVFTPNDDTFNDYFEINTNNPNVILNFKVYNREGVVVYSTTSYRVLWDGRTLSGQELDPGVYYYILEVHQAPAGNLRELYDKKTGFIHLYR